MMMAKTAMIPPKANDPVSAAVSEARQAAEATDSRNAAGFGG